MPMAFDLNDALGFRRRVLAWIKEDAATQPAVEVGLVLMFVGIEVLAHTHMGRSRVVEAAADAFDTLSKKDAPQ